MRLARALALIFIAGCSSATGPQEKWDITANFTQVHSGTCSSGSCSSTTSRSMSGTVTFSRGAPSSIVLDGTNYAASSASGFSFLSDAGLSVTLGASQPTTDPWAGSITWTDAAGPRANTHYGTFNARRE